MRHVLFPILIGLLLSCAPEQTRSPDPDDPITWRASVAALEAVVLPALREFDPSLQNAFTRENGSAGLDVVARGLEDRNVVVLLVERERDRSFVQVTQIGVLKLEPEGFAARLEQKILVACALAFERSD
jgi:hypothetical protein